MEASEAQSPAVCPWSSPRGMEQISVASQASSLHGGLSNSVCSSALAGESQSLPSRTLTQNKNQPLKELGSK